MTSLPNAAASGPLPDAVHELLARFVQLAREVEPYLQDPQSESVYVDIRQGSWTQPMLVQFRREIAPYPAAVALLQFAAEHAGHEVRYRDFLAGSAWTDTQVRTELGAMSKVARKLFGRKTWPLRTRQGSDGVMAYFMPEEIAAWWTAWGAPA